MEILLEAKNLSKEYFKTTGFFLELRLQLRH